MLRCRPTVYVPNALSTFSAAFCSFFFGCMASIFSAVFSSSSFFILSSCGGASWSIDLLLSWGGGFGGALLGEGVVRTTVCSLEIGGLDSFSGGVGISGGGAGGSVVGEGGVDGVVVR